MKTLFAYFLCVFFAAAVYAADSPWSASVVVKVSAQSELTSQIESYVKRELRALHDVSLTEDQEHADYCISIVALQLSNRASDNAGYAISTVVSSPFKSETLSLIVSAAGGNTNLLSAYSTNSTGLVTIQGHDLRIAPPNKLKRTCEELVAHIDSEYFEPDRQSFARMKAMLKQFRNPPSSTRPPP